MLANTQLCTVLGYIHVLYVLICTNLFETFYHCMLHTDCVGVMQKKPNKNKTGKDALQQVTIVKVPITEVETSPTKRRMYM